MINILYEMIKILYGKMLNAICLYWFHNDIPEENNSLNGHFKERWINMNRSLSYLLSNKIFLEYLSIAAVEIIYSFAIISK